MLYGSSALTLARICAFAIALLILVPTGYALVLGASMRWSPNLSRVQWRQAEIARRFGEIWARETAGRPLRIVNGRNWVADLVGVTASDHPSIFNHGNLTWSPWITPERIARQGMLIVWDGTISTYRRWSAYARQLLAPRFAGAH
jgi:hypothetical protein